MCLAQASEGDFPFLEVPCLYIRAEGSRPAAAASITVSRHAGHKLLNTASFH